MRTITRNPNPPECLADQPAGQDWGTFMETECHPLVGTSLRTEQQHLCCYCEAAIAEAGSHIEHMVPRSANPGHDYDYGNLAASCDGGTVEHCGHFKDNRHKNPNYMYDGAKFCVPHDPSTSRLFRYLPDGDIVPAPGLSPQDQAKADYMIGYLGLGCPRLHGRRRAHARQLMNTLGPIPDPTVMAWAVSFYLQPNANSILHSFNSLSRTILAQ